MSTSFKEDVYENVTNHFIAQLSNGIIPWKISWTGNGQPQNMLTQKKYRGLNTWILLGHDYAQNLFLTEPQIKALGASIKPNQTGYPIIYWKTLEGQEKPSIQSFIVYNLDQCKGIPEDKIPTISGEEMPVIKKCGQIVAQMPTPPAILHDEEDTLYYDNVLDFINLPPMAKFESIELYYKTLFNELVRSAFHPSRLKKQEVELKQFNAEPFTLDALVEEMGGNYLSSLAGLNIPEYGDDEEIITRWIEVFQKDKYLLVRAGTLAQKAVDFILGGTGNNEAEQPSLPLEEGKTKKKAGQKRQPSK